MPTLAAVLKEIDTAKSRGKKDEEMQVGPGPLSSRFCPEELKYSAGGEAQGGWAELGHPVGHPMHVLSVTQTACAPQLTGQAAS